MNEAILSQLGALELNDGGECRVHRLDCGCVLIPFHGRAGRTIGCFDFAYSLVARSGSYAMVGPRLAQDEEYLRAVKDHILGMIVTTRVQFLVPDCLKRWRGPFLMRNIADRLFCQVYRRAD